MATRRGGSKGKARRGGKQPARRRRAGTSGGRRAGARRTRTTGAAHEVRAAEARRAREARELEAHAARELEAEARERPNLRLAEPPRVEPMPGAEAEGEAAASLHDVRRDAMGTQGEAAEMARRIEAAAGSAMDDLQRRTEAASRELGRRRVEMEAEARRREAERDLPGAASMGLELAAGALRLVGAMVTAPIRIGLAFLRPREA